MGDVVQAIAKPFKEVVGEVGKVFVDEDAIKRQEQLMREQQAATQKAQADKVKRDKELRKQQISNEAATSGSTIKLGGEKKKLGSVGVSSGLGLKSGNTGVQV